MTFFRAHPAAHVTGIDLYLPPELNAWDLNISRALDGGGGGRVSPLTALTVAGQGIASRSPVRLGGVTPADESLRASGHPVRLSVGANITDVNNQTLGPAAGILRRCDDPSAVRVHDLVAAGNAGSLFWVTTSVANVWQIVINRSGFVGAYVVMLQPGFSSALLYDTGTVWRLLCSANCAAGVDA